MRPWYFIFLPFSIDLSTWLLPFWVDTITCLQMVWGDHHKFAITIQKCKWYIFQSVILRFDKSHRYLYVWLIIHFRQYTTHNGTGSLFGIVICHSKGKCYILQLLLSRFYLSWCFYNYYLLLVFHAWIYFKHKK